MPLISLKKKSASANLASIEATDPAQTPTWSLFDLPGSTSFNIGEDGSESIPLAGGRSNPLTLTNAGMLAAGVIHAQVTVEYVQGAASSAVVFANQDPDAPYTFLEDLSLRFGGKAADINAGGRALHGWTAEAFPGFIDDTTSAVLPAANTGTTSVTTTVTHNIYYLVPVAASLDWPAGMVMMANKAVTVGAYAQWKAWTDLVTVDTAAGSTATVQSASFTWRSLTQAIPLDAAAMPGHLLLYAHSLAEYTKAADKTRTQIQLAEGVTGDIMRLGVMTILPNGVRDVANSLNVTNVKLKKNGSDYGIDCNPGTLSYIRNLRARRLANYSTPETGVGATGYDGILWLPLDVGGGRNWIPAAELAALSVEVTFASAPPANTTVAVIAEQMQSLVVQNQSAAQAGTGTVA